jgi:hypothetical protein
MIASAAGVSLAGQVLYQFRIKRAAITIVACRPGGFAAPEELWYRNASNGLHKFAGRRRVGANLWLARIAGGPL